MTYVIALLAGIIFGGGLTVSQMINPQKVQDFLDLAGQWDASLLFVMIGALVVTWIGYRFVLRLPSPLCVQQFSLPTKKVIDKSLLIGAAIFGIGWGLAGYCPGPGITALGLGIMDAVYFVIGMAVAAVMFRFL